MRAVMKEVSANKMKLWSLGKRSKAFVALGEKLCRLLKVLVSVESWGRFRFRFDFAQWIKVITHLKRVDALISLVTRMWVIERTLASPRLVFLISSTLE